MSVTSLSTRGYGIEFSKQQAPAHQDILGLSEACDRIAEVAGQKDQVFKELLREFFPDFVRLFYPQIAAQLDWSTLRFLDKETFTDFPRGEQQDAGRRAGTNPGTCGDRESAAARELSRAHARILFSPASPL